MGVALPDLPAVAAVPELRAALAAPGSAAVFSAPPGSGKTTALPLSLLDEPWMRGAQMLLLEPRRVAARAAAWRMSDLAGDAPGGLVGYRMRLEGKSSAATRVLVLTEGMLARMVLADPELRGVALVVFDEFHERSLQADFGLALALDARRGLRPDLRILVMSATIDESAVAAKLGPGTAALRAGGRLYPVETEFAAFPQEPSIARKTALGVRRALAARAGSVLAFLPGEGEIRTCVSVLSESGSLPRDVDLRPLFAALPRAEQDAALAPPPPGRRKVVLATSIAESSLTIDGVGCVVDSGWARVSQFSPDTGMSHLETVRVSRDRADQRAGRAGRLGPGWCLRLWDEGTDRRLAPSSPPEILDADLAPVALACADWGVSEPGGLPWPTLPPADSWRAARETLAALGALGRDGAVTPLGREMAALGVHPRLARMVLGARALGDAAFSEACLLAAALSENLPSSARPSSNAEHLVRDLQEGGGPVPPPLRARIRELARSIARSASGRGAGPAPAPGGAPERAVPTGELLALAYPDRVARRRALAKSEGRYRMVAGRGACLAPGDGLARSEWIVVAEIDGADADGAIRLAAPLRGEEVERLFSDRFETARILEWNARTERVDAVTRTSLGAVPVRETPLPDPDPEAVLAALCAGIRAAGISRLGWTDAAARLRERVAFARRAAPDEGFPDWSDEALARDLESWLGPRLFGLHSLAQAAKADLASALRDSLGALARRLDALAPAAIVVPTGTHVAVDYSGNAPVASVRLQECFGMTETPRVAGGRVPVLLQLLSPAMRPVQTTSDIASFWRGGYALVRKEMRGRYPRHYWPEDPLSATPTRRAKPRS